MKPIIRVALLSFWHVHAKDYFKQAVEHPEIEIAGIWDEQPERGRLEAEERGVPFFENLQDILSNKDIDAVIVTTPTIMHPAVITAAAKAGKHVFTEKVMALSNAECQEIVASIDHADVVMTVSLPRLNTPFTQGALGIRESGLLGELTLVRARLSHSGALPTADNPKGYLPAHFFELEESGGGAMIDLGCHPMYLTRLLLGLPESLSASFGYVTGKEVEDNAAVTLRYANGALGIVEAGFVNRASPFTLELHGTDGSAIYSAHDGKLIYRSLKLEGDGVKQWHVYDLPPALPSSFDQWVSHIRNGTKARDNIELALDLTKLMEASNRSAQLGMVQQIR